MYENYKTTKFSVTSYGRTTTIEVDHADVDMEEFLDIVKVMAIGMTFHEDTWKRSIIELGSQYEEEMREEEEKVYRSDPTLEKEANDYLAKLSDKEIDEAFAEHNSIEEDDWDVTLNDGLEDDGWTKELEEEFWKEQPPYPFATDIELEAMGENPPLDSVEEGEFDDYGMRIPKGETISEKADRESNFRWEQKKEWRDRLSKEMEADSKVIFEHSKKEMQKKNEKKKKDAKRK